MGTSADDELYRRAAALLKPGEIRLHGAVVHTGIPVDDEPALHQATIEIGDVIATHADEPETFVYSGTDDPEFGLNQHQGRTLAEERFVWECQQLQRGETFDVVFYWEAGPDHRAVCSAIAELGYEVVGVTAQGPLES
ncbi:MAG: DUF5778 family protein [Halobacteriaceae archaeon]